MSASMEKKFTTSKYDIYYGWTSYSNQPSHDYEDGWYKFLKGDGSLKWDGFWVSEEAVERYHRLRKFYGKK